MSGGARTAACRLVVLTAAGGAIAVAFAGAALAQAPGLPRTYDVKRIDSPNPLGGGAFGWGVASADFTGDGETDLAVAQAQTGPGQIFLFDGATGAHIDTIDPPEHNPDRAAQPETLAFVYVETMPDIGSCPGGDGGDADEICDLANIAGGDGIPEIVAGSRNLRVDAADGAAPPDTTDPRIGRAYVFDGATRAVLKRIDMPAAERQDQLARGASPQFGRLVMPLQGLEPCAGSSAENNAVGVTPCPPRTVDDACRPPRPATPAAPADDPRGIGRCIRIGDVNALGQPDLVITARNYAGTTPGKVWVYPGEAIAGSDPREILETPIYGVPNPRPGGAEFGGNVFRVGDVTGPLNAQGARTPPDGRPDFVVAARNYSAAEFPNIGAAYLLDGATGALVQTIVHPEPQPRAQFSGSFNSGRPAGDLGATGTPDILLPAPLQNALSTDDGRAWVFNGDAAAGGGATGSWQFATLTDPTPVVGGNFGGAQTGMGDLVDDVANPANEVLVAGFNFDPFSAPARNQVADLHIMNAETQRNLQTIPHPDGTPGDGFGVGLAPMGDLNDDGFLDFAASAYLANLQEAGQGRAYIFTSNNSRLPDPPPAAPPPPPPPPPAQPRELRAGACANDVTGTAAGEHLIGTIAGDNVFGLAGDDFVNGFQGDDCIAGGAGADRLDGGPDADKIVGGRHADRLRGADGADRLYGSSGHDYVDAGDGHDLLAGGPGRDRLLGRHDRDRIYGEKGRDLLRGGPGRNVLDGGPGRDAIYARNGERDTVLCGGGRDRVWADPTDSLNGCERIRRSLRR